MGAYYSHMWNGQRIKTKVVYKETLLPFLHHLNPPWSWYYLYSDNKKAKARGTGNFPCCTALRWQDPSFSLTYRCHIQATPCDQCFHPSVMFESLKTICDPVLGDAGLPCWLFPTPSNADELPGSSPGISHISTANGSQGLASLGWLSVGFFPNKICLCFTRQKDGGQCELLDHTGLGCQLECGCTTPKDRHRKPSLSLELTSLTACQCLSEQD